MVLPLHTCGCKQYLCFFSSLSIELGINNDHKGLKIQLYCSQRFGALLHLQVILKNLCFCTDLHTYLHTYIFKYRFKSEKFNPRFRTYCLKFKMVRSKKCMRLNLKNAGTNPLKIFEKIRVFPVLLKFHVCSSVVFSTSVGSERAPSHTLSKEFVTHNHSKEFHTNQRALLQCCSSLKIR